MLFFTGTGRSLFCALSSSSLGGGSSLVRIELHVVFRSGKLVVSSCFGWWVGSELCVVMFVVYVGFCLGLSKKKSRQCLP